MYGVKSYINIAVIKVAVFVCAVLFVVWMDFVVVFAVVDFQRHGGIVVWLFWIWVLKIDLCSCVFLGCWWRPVALVGV